MFIYLFISTDCIYRPFLVSQRTLEGQEKNLDIAYVVYMQENHSGAF